MKTSELYCACAKFESLSTIAGEMAKALEFYDDAKNYRDKYDYGDNNVAQDRGKTAYPALQSYREFIGGEKV